MGDINVDMVSQWSVAHRRKR